MARLKVENESILKIIALFSDGASIDEIFHSIAIPKRTLQRHLASMVRSGYVHAVGNGRSRRYLLGQQQIILPDTESNLIPLSPIAQKLQEEVQGPIQARKPVSYNREFLDHYRPNVTFYLSKQTRQHLLKLGKTDGLRPAGTYARQIFSRLLVDLSWNSSRLEGNTYSLLDTERLLKLSQFPEGKNLKEARMILNHKDAIEFLVDSAQEIGINKRTFLTLHAFLSYDLLGDLEECGRLRTCSIAIGKSVYQPLSTPQVLEECFQQILDTANAIQDPFEQAFFLMCHLPYLQPFIDVNKRVSRIGANIPLILNNLCPLSFVDVPEKTYVNGLLAIYELNRVDLFREVFIWAYERSALRYSITKKELGEPDPLRIRYRDLMTTVISKIVRDLMSKKEANDCIQDYALKEVPQEDRLGFIENVKKDVYNLHEGNIARHKLKPTEFEAWRLYWR